MTGPFDPIRLRELELPNRLAMAPIKTACGTKTGQVTERLLAYFRRRAEGGVGLVISEPLYVSRRGQEHPLQLGIDADDKTEGLGRLVEAIHAGGAKAFAHLNHAGRASNPKAAGAPPEAPSKVTCPRTGAEPEELEPERIGRIVEEFASAAARAREAGFDGVELQFGLGYLVSQFLSTRTNLREDGYGGNAEGRQRFAREVFASVHGAVGKDMAIGVRISGSEKVEGGLEIDDAIALARALESWGADLVHVVTGSNCDSLPWYFQHMALPPGVNETLASRIREKVGIPVMVAGRLGDPPRLREVLAGGMADMVALGRPLVADPDLPAKMREGRDDEVLLCGHCLQGCFVNVKAGQGIGCNINPLAGHELEEVLPADRPRHVAVVGGGPAGIQAALTARRRGHRVTLFESDRLGGQFALAHLSPGKGRIRKSLDSLVSMLEHSDVEVRIGEEATREKLERLGIEAVVLATGSRPVVPDIPGLEDPVAGEDVLTGERKLEGRVLVLGGGMVAVEVAETLAKAGAEVVAVRRSSRPMADDMDPLSRKMTMMRLSSLPVELHNETRVAAFENGEAFVEEQGGRRSLGVFDHVVAAAGNESHDTLSDSLRAAGIEVILAGDAERPGKVIEAVCSGHQAGMHA